MKSPGQKGSGAKFHSNEVMEHLAQLFRPKTQRESTWCWLLTPQTHHHVNANDFVACRWHWNFTDRNVSRRDVHQLVPILQIIMMVFRVVGIKIRPRGVDRDLSQETDLGKLVQSIINRCERNWDVSLARFLKEHFSRDVTITFRKQNVAQSNRVRVGRSPISRNLFVIWFATSPLR
jgi:hypothetical protein